MKMNFLKKVLLGLCLATAFSACSDDDNDFVGTDNSITAFTLSLNGQQYKAYVSDNEIVVAVPEGVSLNGANAVVKLSENAVISPDPAGITAWDEEYSFTVKAYNEATHSYTYRLVYTPVVSEGNIVLGTQAAVDAFAASGVSVVEGSLTIGVSGSEDTIRDLSGLAKLKEVTYTLSVSSNYAGKDLSGLSKLEKVGRLSIGNNPAFTEVSLPALTRVGQGVSIESPYIEQVVLPELSFVGEDFTMSCDSLRSMNFASLESVGGGLTLKGVSGYRGENLKISKIEIPVLKTIGGQLHLENWSNVNQVSFPELISCGDFYMYTFPMLTQLEFPKLQRCEEKVLLLSCSELTEVSFPKLEWMKNMEIRLCSKVTRLDLSSLKEVGEKLDLQDLAITDLSGLRSLEKVGGRFNLQGMPEVTSLDGLTALKSVGEWQIYNLPAISEVNVKGLELGILSLQGSTIIGTKVVGDRVFSGVLSLNDASNSQVQEMPVLEGIEVLGGFSLSAQSMTTFEWPGIKEITGKIEFSSVNAATRISMPDLEKVGTLKFGYVNRVQSVEFPKLVSVEENVEWQVTSSAMTKVELPELASVGGNFTLQLGTNPVSVVSMPKLTTIGGELKLPGSNWSKNNSLTNLDGFSALTSVGKVTIQYHAALVSFAGLKHVVDALEDSQWTVSGNGYNPKLSDMKAGKYTEE